MTRVFISYKHEDGDFVDILIEKFELMGFDTWVDNDRLKAGDEWRERIDQAIKEADVLVVVMTPEAKVSEYITYEWAFGWH